MAAKGQKMSIGMVKPADCDVIGIDMKPIAHNKTHRSLVATDHTSVVHQHTSYSFHTNAMVTRSRLVWSKRPNETAFGARPKPDQDCRRRLRDDAMALSGH